MNSVQEVKQLRDYVDQKSWFFFTALGCDGRFLRKVDFNSYLVKLKTSKLLLILQNFSPQPISEWKEDEEYLNAKAQVESMLVVNDVAERAVQLGSKLRSSVK